MKKLVLTFLLFLFIFSQKNFANGVCIIDAQQGEYLTLVSSDIDALVKDQIATVTLTATYRNNTGGKPIN